MAIYKLTATQLITFLEYTWNCHLPKWHQNLFSSILEFEESRTFSEGWDYCSSTLEISIVATRKKEYSWEYTTTSGTILSASIDAAYSQEVYSVTIPDHRDQPGRTAHTDMQAVLAGHSYWSWEEQQDESNPDALAAAAFFQGVTVGELLATRKKEKEEEKDRREERRQQLNSNDDSDWGDFGDAIEEEEEEEEEEKERRKRLRYELNDAIEEEEEEDAYG